MSNIVSEQSPVERYYAENGELPPCQPWCVNHESTSKFPTDGFCQGERSIIAGVETYLTNGTSDDETEIVIRQRDNASEGVTAVQAAALARRLDELGTWITAPGVALAMHEGRIEAALEATINRLTA